MSTPRQFVAQVPDEDLADLGERLTRTRLQDQPPGDARTDGAGLGYPRTPVERIGWTSDSGR